MARSRGLGDVYKRQVVRVRRNGDNEWRLA
jgi:hypothetical protein